MIIISGIYKIVNVLDQKYYIGSSVNIDRRWYHHKRYAKLNSMKCPYLYSAMRKYGIENFICIPLIICAKEHLELYEQKLLDIHYGKDQCYNASSNAVTPMRNPSPATRKKLSDNMSRLRKGKSSWNKGIPRTEKDKKTISATIKIAMSKLDNSCSDEAKRKLSIALTGRKFSKETKKKMSIAKLGKDTWNKGIAHPTSAKLTIDQVKDIRAKYVYGTYGIQRIAKEYNVNNRTIDAIIKRRTWNHVL